MSAGGISIEGASRSTQASWAERLVSVLNDFMSLNSSLIKVNATHTA